MYAVTSFSGVFQSGQIVRCCTSPLLLLTNLAMLLQVIVFALSIDFERIKHDQTPSGQIKEASVR
jgi:hypothetical protein